MNTFKTALALLVAAGLNTAAFAQTVPAGGMQNTPGSNQATPTVPGNGTVRDGNSNNDGNRTDGNMRSNDRTMRNADGTMRTSNSSTDRRMKTKGNMTNGKGKMKTKSMN